jgi:hypothetical protein
MFQLEPFGERRADLRSAFNAVVAIANNGFAKLPEDSARELLEVLTTYVGPKVEQESGPGAFRNMMGG